MVEGRIGHQLLGRHRRLRHRGPPSPGTVMLDRARPEEADGRHADRRRHMHQTRIIADEQAAAFEAGSRFQRIDPADEIEPAVGRKRVQNWPDGIALAVCAENGDARAQQRPGGGEPPRQLGEALRTPGLGAPVRRRPQGQHRRSGGDEPGCRRSLGRSEPKAGCGRRLAATNEAAQRLDAMPVAIALAENQPSGGRDEVGERRAPEVDDELPAPDDGPGPEVEPMRTARPLGQHVQPIEAGYIAEDRRCDWACGDAHPHAGHVFQAMGEDARRQHGIAEPGRGDEQEGAGHPPAYRAATWRLQSAASRAT